MDATILARRLLEPLPAAAALGLEVLYAVDGDAEVALTVTPGQADAIGALHSGGLVTVVDTAGLAAVLAGCDDELHARTLVTTPCLTSTEFLAPARGRIVAHCSLSSHSRSALRPVLVGHTDRVQLTTDVAVIDGDGLAVCRGTFRWNVRSYARHGRPLA